MMNARILDYSSCHEKFHSLWDRFLSVVFYVQINSNHEFGGIYLPSTSLTSIIHPHLTHSHTP
jgi:hypothetical protein